MKNQSKTIDRAALAKGIISRCLSRENGSSARTTRFTSGSTFSWVPAATRTDGSGRYRM